MIPRPRYIPDMCARLLTTLGPTFDSDIARMVRSLGNDRSKLKDLFFEMVLQVTDPKLESNSSLKFDFMVVLIDFLHMTGYCDISPHWFEYVVDPVYDVDTLLDLMIGTRMPTFTASDLNGDFATIFQLASFFPEVIRRNALIIKEKPLMARRFRQWIGDIGFSLMTRQSSSLSQSDRTFLVIASNTLENSKGYITDLPGITTEPIPPIQCKDPLVVEVGQLAVSLCQSGPCINHMKLVSNGILEDLVLYYGPHVPDLKTFVGYQKVLGPFNAYIVSPEDALPWALESQITGISSLAANVTLRAADMPPFSIQTPLLIRYRNKGGDIALYPDLPDMNLWLTNDRDCSRFTWDYFSSWRGRRINSLLDGGSMDYALADLGLLHKTAGACQVEMPDLSQLGVCWLHPSLKSKVTNYSGVINEV